MSQKDLYEMYPNMVGKKKPQERGLPDLSGLLCNLSEDVREAAEQQLTDALTLGQGFAKQTNYPPKLEYVKYSCVVQTKDIS